MLEFLISIVGAGDWVENKNYIRPGADYKLTDAFHYFSSFTGTLTCEAGGIYFPL